MNYSPEEWDALIAEVHAQGGTLLPDKCNGQVVSFSVKNTDRVTKTRTCNCKNESLVVTLYDPSTDPDESKRMRDRGAGFTRVCAVCDAVGAWPSFAHVIPTEEEHDDA